VGALCLSVTTPQDSQVDEQPNPDSSRCRVSVEVRHEERLAFVQGLVTDVVSTGIEHGFGVRAPSVHGGRLTQQKDGTPLSFFWEHSGYEFCEPSTQSQSLGLLEVCPPNDLQADITWCDAHRKQMNLSDFSSKGKRYVCVPGWSCGGREGSWDAWGERIARVAKWIPREYPAASNSTQWVLRLPVSMWYKQLQNSTRTRFQYRLSAAMQQLSNSFRALHSGEGTPLCVAAAERLAYRGNTASLDTMADSCQTRLGSLNSAVTSVRGRAKDCSFYIGSDWLANADGDLDKKHAAILEKCWQRHILSPSTPPWWYVNTSVKDRVFNTAMGEFASKCQTPGCNMRNFMKDRPGFFAMLDVAMLVMADECYGKSHMVSMVADPLRVNMGKTSCSSDKAFEARGAYGTESDPITSSYW